MCTLLHCELRDYSLGQIAFAVFQALFAITQLLCHVEHVVNKHLQTSIIMEVPVIFWAPGEKLL